MSSFSIEHRLRKPAQILDIKGFLDAHTAPQLETKLESIIREGGYNIVVNFRELDYISSAGLGVFMVFIEEVRNKLGDIKLVSMQPKVFTVFDLLGFPMLFEILEHEDEAIANFRDAGNESENG